MANDTTLFGKVSNPFYPSHLPGPPVLEKSLYDEIYIFHLFIPFFSACGSATRDERLRSYSRVIVNVYDSSVLSPSALYIHPTTR